MFSWYRFSRYCMAALLIVFYGCTLVGDVLAAVVAGKAVYRSMGIEGASITAIDNADKVVADNTLSTYHGSFILHLELGEYSLRAAAAVPVGVNSFGEQLR